MTRPVDERKISVDSSLYKKHHRAKDVVEIFCLEKLMNLDLERHASLLLTPMDTKLGGASISA